MGKFKHILIWCVALVVCSFFGVQATAYAESIFSFADGVINGFVSVGVATSTIVIPSEINGNPVTAIDNNGGVSFGNASLKGIVKELDLSQASNLTAIKADAFSGIELTGTLVLPESLTSIGKYNFNTCDFDKIIVKGTTPISVTNTSFNVEDNIVFTYGNVIPAFVEKDNDWSNYNLCYVLTINMGTETIEVGEYEYGTKFSNYEDVLSTYLSGYSNVVLKQGEEVVTANTVLDGTTLQFASGDKNNVVDYDEEEITLTYGEECNISAPIDGTYEWIYKDTTVSTEKEISPQLNAGTHTYLLRIKNGGEVVSEITYTIIVNPITINYTWPSLKLYEYYDMQNVKLLQDEYSEVLYIEYYSGGDLKTSFSIGEFTAIVKPYDTTNYVVNNSSFDFEIVRTELTVSWDANCFNYTGSNISPTYVLHGNTRDLDLELIYTTDSDDEESEVGEYTIVIERVSDEFYCLSASTSTTFNWSIIPTELVVDWSNNQFSYTGQAHTPTAVGKYQGIEIDLDVKSVDNKNFVNVDTYSLVASVPSNYTGFTLSGQLTSTCTILPTMLNVSFDCLTTYTYSGQYVEIVPVINTEINEDVQLVVVGNRYKDAGEYTCKVTGTNNPNYVISDNIELSWKILPKSLSVNWKSSKYEYNGYVQIPKPSVDTGISGETLTLNVKCDNNKLVNEDSKTGYPISVTIDNPNYKISNPTSEYFITRATAHISGLENNVEVVYNGEYFIPSFKFVGDDGYLQMFVNGVKSDVGVKEVGTYQLSFTAPKSPNYKAMDTYYCMVRIKNASIEAIVDTTTVTATNSNGFNNTTLSVTEVDSYEDKTLTIANQENYNIYKVLNVSNLEHDQDNYLSFEVEDVNPKNLRIFVLEGENLIEKEVTISDGKVSVEGGNGTYFILMAKPKWIATTGGVLTMIGLLLVVCAVLTIPLFKRNSKNREEKKINAEVEKRIAHKLELGEVITDETMKTVREEVINELNNNDEKADK